MRSAATPACFSRNGVVDLAVAVRRYCSRVAVLRRFAIVAAILLAERRRCLLAY